MSRLDELRRLNDNNLITTSELREHFEHLKSISFKEKIEKYINDVVFIRERYLFILRIGKKVYAQCSYCGHREIIDRVPKQKSEHACAHCDSKLVVRNTKYNNHKEGTYYEFVHFEKSSLSKDIIVAYQFGVARSFIENLDENTNIKPHDRISVEAYYYFDLKSKNRVVEDRYSIYSTEKDNSERGRICKSVYLVSSNKHYYWGISINSLHEAITGSAFKYSGYDDYLSRFNSYYSYSHLKAINIIKYLDFYSRFPKMEYLIKSGFEKLVYDILEGKPSHRTLNWKGATLEKILKINKREMAIFKSLNDCSFEMLAIFQSLKAQGLLNDEELKAAKILKTCAGTVTDLKLVINADKPSRIVKYLNKQRENYPDQYRHLGAAYLDFCDLLKDMKILGIKAAKKTLYYKNLHRHHMNLNKQVVIKVDELKDQQFKNRLNQLDKYRFENKDLAILPVESSKQLIQEGKELGHCVGGYVDRHAKGETNIFLLRKKEDLEKPYFTIEIDKNFERIVQCRGKSNIGISTNKAADAFLSEYKANILIGRRREQNESCTN